MTPDFKASKDSRHISPGNSQNSREMDNLLRDRSELLSAYIDGEVTAAERKQVQHWLNTDPQMQRLYARMVKLHQGIQTLPVPSSEQAAENMVQGVFARIAQRRTRNALVWGGTAMAALLISALSGVFSGSQSPIGQIAANNTKTSPTTEEANQPLMVALNRPVVEIPKAAIASPEKSVK